MWIRPGRATRVVRRTREGTLGRATSSPFTRGRRMRSWFRQEGAVTRAVVGHEYGATACQRFGRSQRLVEAEHVPRSNLGKTTPPIPCSARQSVPGVVKRQDPRRVLGRRTARESAVASATCGRPGRRRRRHGDLARRECASRRVEKQTSIGRIPVIFASSEPQGSVETSGLAGRDPSTADAAAGGTMVNGCA